jgi:leucyl/phenylalanyl-tRNA---protein transferase
MPLITIDEDFDFPPLDYADEEGLLLIGGKLTAQKVLEAYGKGIFPWYSESEPVLWWSPDPRFVLFPGELHVSRSMQKLLRQGKFEFRTDTAFPEVIRNCKTIDRIGQHGTWITKEIENVYSELFEMGYGHSAEAWLNGELVGGMYGIQLGKVFFGESMFSKETNASKFAFIQYVQQLLKEGVQLVDCQVYTEHVESLGARLIPRSQFIQLLESLF